MTVNIHQGSSIFSKESRGIQCVANSLVFIAHKEVNTIILREWTQEDTHFVLKNGDTLYKHVRESCDHSYLHPHDLPEDF